MELKGCWASIERSNHTAIERSRRPVGCPFFSINRIDRPIDGLIRPKPDPATPLPTYLSTAMTTTMVSINS